MLTSTTVRYTIRSMVGYSRRAAPYVSEAPLKLFISPYACNAVGMDVVRIKERSRGTRVRRNRKRRNDNCIM